MASLYPELRGRSCLVLSDGLGAGAEPIPVPTAVRTRGTRSLRHVLAYKNPKVVSRFQDHYEIGDTAATAIFRDTLRWLWACARSREIGGPKLAIFTSMTVIDEMWHEFILCTHDYSSFCDDYLAGYVHHEPFTRADRAAFHESSSRDPMAQRKLQEDQLTAIMGFIHDHLGERVMYRWFRTYKRRYTAEFLHSHRLPMT